MSQEVTQKTAESPDTSLPKTLDSPPPLTLTPFQLHRNYQLDLQNSGSAKSAVLKHGKIWNTDGFKYLITRTFYREERMERPEIKKDILTVISHWCMSMEKRK